MSEAKLLYYMIVKYVYYITVHLNHTTYLKFLILRKIKDERGMGLICIPAFKTIFFSRILKKFLPLTAIGCIKEEIQIIF